MLESHDQSRAGLPTTFRSASELMKETCSGLYVCKEDGGAYIEGVNKPIRDEGMNIQ